MRLCSRFVVGLLSLLVIGGCQRTAQQEPATSFGHAVVPGQTLAFPADHGPHPRYALEWWYLTANLWDQHGQHHGLQYTLFRFKGPQQHQGDWWDGQWYMAHLMWEHNGNHQAWERFGRGIGQAGVTAQPFAAWLDNWQLASKGDEFLPLVLNAEQQQVALQIEFAESPIVMHGDNGFSDKSGDGTLASYYYSLPRLKALGTLTANGQSYQLSGNGWLDREWSSALLDQRFNGWDWISLNLDDGNNLMLFCLRGAEENPSNCEGSWITEAGKVAELGEYQLTAQQWVALDDGRYPISWSLSVPSRQLNLTIKSRSSDQRNQLTTRYWEGPVIASGSHSGYGFIEMTGRASEKP